MRSGTVGQTGNYLRESCDSVVDVGRKTDSPEQTSDKPIKNSTLHKYKVVRVGDELWSTVTLKLYMRDYIIQSVIADAYVNNFILMRFVKYLDE